MTSDNNLTPLTHMTNLPKVCIIIAILAAHRFMSPTNNRESIMAWAILGNPKINKWAKLSSNWVTPTCTRSSTQSLPALLQREDIKRTMFTELFELKKRDKAARKLTYAELPTRYVWNEQLKIRKLRKQKKCIGRIFYSSPASGERYYLRMLLNVVRGPKSFKKLMTVNKKVYGTFKEVCFAYGLLNEDKEWTQAIIEASFWALGPKLRDLFVTILLFCDVSKPLNLWEETWEVLSEDILHHKRKVFNYPELELTEEQIKTTAW
ncbi:hypothetical protein CTI12_AA367600 [Artemisia annua]|uniref:Uncharacterized protein n=1 Tax=Artemisia annua TaxID=35608 RepID=A0A2U1ML31_ARTAN|nr:hypothetical protein CTI12_AA367600 [Artemisia annua]